MSAYQLDVQVTGDEELERKLRGMGNRAIMAQPAMEEILDVFRSSERALWSRGRSCVPNAPGTVQTKGRNSPLRWTGRLERSLTEEGNPDQIAEATNDSARLGSKLWYAHFAVGTDHQPKREVVKLRVEDRARVSEIVRRWVLEGHEAGMMVL